MNFTLSAQHPVIDWDSIAVKINDTTYQCGAIHKVFQEKVKKDWQNRFQIMMPILVFQQFLRDQNTGGEKKSAFIFYYDHQIVTAQFKDNQREVL
jgi:hypothetical protein